LSICDFSLRDIDDLRQVVPHILTAPSKWQIKNAQCSMLNDFHLAFAAVQRPLSSIDFAGRLAYMTRALPQRTTKSG
jgi:hypothetical protein